MGSIKPDTSVYALQQAQPEFQELAWQYINRRVSDWRIRAGKEVAGSMALCSRVEREYGVDRHLLLALWGVESAYGDPIVQQKYMRPVFPALAALAWGEPRRRAYWEKELLNALTIVERGWSTPAEMRGSWAGAMGHIDSKRDASTPSLIPDPLSRTSSSISSPRAFVQTISRGSFAEADASASSAVQDEIEHDLLVLNGIAGGLGSARLERERDLARGASAPRTGEDGPPCRQTSSRSTGRCGTPPVAPAIEPA